MTATLADRRRPFADDRRFVGLPGFDPLPASASIARIGNDVVDLEAAAASDASRDLERYAARICTRRELEWLDAFCTDRPQAARSRAVWSLWAAKEAAFKAGFGAALAGSGDREAAIAFIPRRLEIWPDARLATASVRSLDASFPVGGLRVCFVHSSRWVHALCHAHPESPVCYWVARALDLQPSGDARDESLAVRELVFVRMERLWGLPRNSMRVRGGRGSGRPPWLELRFRRSDRPLRLPISLSHDGEWLAAAVPRISPLFF